MPKISVVMNCHNGASFLKESIQSVFNQTFTDWEIIFFNNFSTDNSEEIAHSFGNKVKVFNSRKLLNLGHARAEALNLSNGEWITFLDTDDLWMKKKLEIQIEEIEGSDFALGYSGVEEIDQMGKAFRKQIPKYNSGYIFNDQLQNFEINMVTPIINANFLSMNNLNFNHNFTASEEYNLFMKICALSPVMVQKKILGSYRIYEESLTNKFMKNWASERFETLDYLKDTHKKIFDLNKKGFEAAYARGEYYLARYHYENGNKSQAKTLIKKNIHVSMVYLFLYLMANIPLLWKFFHKRKVKSLLSKFLKIS